MKIEIKNIISVLQVKRFIIIFYIIGTLGFVIPYTKDIFIVLTPYALILNFFLLAVYLKHYNLKILIVFFIIFISGFFIEVIGVETGKVFGVYEYGSGLGLKLFNTPLLIGLNWLYLTYIGVSIISSFKLNKILSLFLTPLLLLVYDIILEQVAPKMDMWHWDNESIPIKNYIAWYIIALIFVFIFKKAKIDARNPLSRVLFITQFLFFIFLMLVLK